MVTVAFVVADNEKGRQGRSPSPSLVGLKKIFVKVNKFEGTAENETHTTPNQNSGNNPTTNHEHAARW